MKSIHVGLALVSLSFAVGCGGVYAAGPLSGSSGQPCGTPGTSATSACTPTAACRAGFVPGVICGANGVYGACTCIPDPDANNGDAGTVQDAGAATETCTDTETRVSACMSCAAGQVGYQTCRSSQWTSCTCVPDLGAGRMCVANTATMNSCMPCNAGFVAQQVCRSNGLGYLACQCVPNGTTQTCVPNSVRNACNPCTNGSAAGTEVCNAAGTAYDCRLSPGATCSGGSTQTCVPNSARNACTFGCSNGGTAPGTEICNASGSGYECRQNSGTTCSGGGTTCTPNASRGTACTFACTSGTSPGTEFCNSAGNGYECRQNAGTTCSGGSGGGGSCRSQPFTLIVRAVNSSLRVRCWDMNGNPVTSSNNELRVTLPGGCGIVHCVDGTGDGSAFVESGYWSTSRSESVTNRFDIASVEGREDSLRNQQGQARICPDGGRSKANIAVNTDRLGSCL